jgi:hypothetical protein
MFPYPICVGVPASTTVFYDWQKQFFENGAAAFIRDTAAKSAKKNSALSSSKQIAPEK